MGKKLIEQEEQSRCISWYFCIYYLNKYLLLPFFHFFHRGGSVSAQPNESARLGKK
jgi:hypothetical protein